MNLQNDNHASVTETWSRCIVQEYMESVCSEHAHSNTRRAERVFLLQKEERMKPLLHIVYFIVISTVNVIGIMADVFIVAVNLLHWAKGRVLKTCDRLLVALGMSGIFSQSTWLADAYLSMVWTEIPNLNSFYPVLIQLQIWACGSFFWLAACLCVFYCVKIVDFNHRLFIRLKLRISKVVPWLMLAAAVGSLVSSIPVYWNLYAEQNLNITNATTSALLSGGGMKWNPTYPVILNAVGFSVPLVLGAASIMLILVSLCRHTQRLKENASGFSQPRMEAHYTAARMVGSLFLIYIIVFLAFNMLSVWSTELLDYLSWMILAFSIPVQSIILILGNTKLKQILCKFCSVWRK